MTWTTPDFITAAQMWREHKSTMQIAVLLGCDESEVWNRLGAFKGQTPAIPSRRAPSIPSPDGTDAGGGFDPAARVSPEKVTG